MELLLDEQKQKHGCGHLHPLLTKPLQIPSPVLFLEIVPLNIFNFNGQYLLTIFYGPNNVIVDIIYTSTGMFDIGVIHTYSITKTTYNFEFYKLYLITYSNKI